MASSFSLMDKRNFPAKEPKVAKKDQPMPMPDLSDLSPASVRRGEDSGSESGEEQLEQLMQQESQQSAPQEPRINGMTSSEILTGVRLLQMRETIAERFKEYPQLQQEYAKYDLEKMVDLAHVFTESEKRVIQLQNYPFAQFLSAGFLGVIESQVPKYEIMGYKLKLQGLTEAAHRTPSYQAVLEKLCKKYLTKSMSVEGQFVAEVVKAMMVINGTHAYMEEMQRKLDEAEARAKSAEDKVQEQQQQQQQEPSTSI